METPELTPGQLVRSKAGRDQERFFLLLGILDTHYALIADGLYRKVEKPKKKKRRHLQLTGLVDEPIVRILEKGRNPSNEQIAEAIQRLVEQL